MSLSTLCQVKTAIHLSQEDYPVLFDYYFNDDIDSYEWERLIKDNIPDKWVYLGDDDAGFKVVLLFETDVIPEQRDFIYLVNSVSRLNTKLSIKNSIPSKGE